MVLTDAQTTLFSMSDTQMVLSVRTATKLTEEGIFTIAYLLEFDAKSISQIADNLHRPSGRVADPNDATATIATPPFVFGAKLQQRLNNACNIVQFYEMIGRTITAPNIRWNLILKNFKMLWSAIVILKESD